LFAAARRISVTPIHSRHVSSAHALSNHHAEDGWLMHMAAKLKQWTLEEVHSLPDDGNKYELVRGQLFVTPPPSFEHEHIGTRLARVLDRYVEAQGLGEVFRPRAVMRFEGSETEPDLMVLPNLEGAIDWDSMPIPILIVEILSASTRRRDLGDKRDFYLDAGVADYWIADPEQKTIRSIGSGREDIMASESLTWEPAGAAQPLVIDLSQVFPSHSPR